MGPRGLWAYFRSDHTWGQRSSRGQFALEMPYGYRGALDFFSGRGVRSGFPKCGACELLFASEKGVCELKISKFGGL